MDLRVVAMEADDVIREELVGADNSDYEYDAGLSDFDVDEGGD